MQSINFDNNLKTYAVNHDESNVVKINTADYGIFDRAKKSRTIFNNLSAEASEAKNKDDEFDILAEIDKKIKQRLNYIFGADVSTPAFGEVNCLSPCNGVPMFWGFLNALLDIIKADMEDSTLQMQKNIEKYAKQLPNIVK